MIRMSFCPQDLGLGQTRLSGWGAEEKPGTAGDGGWGTERGVEVEGGDVCVYVEGGEGGGEGAASLSTVPKSCEETRITATTS